MAEAFDNNLMAAFHRNEPQAVRAIFNDYYTSMVHYAHQLINDQSEAEEMVVNTFIKLITMRQNFRSAEDVKTFLLVTIRNTSYDYLRCLDIEKPSKREMLTLADFAQTNAAGKSIPFSTERLLALYEGMNKLTGQCAEVFRLYFYHKMTTKDVAAQLDIPVKAVRAYKAKAIKVLRAVMTKSITVIPSLN